MTRQFIDAIDRTSFVTTGNHKLVPDGLDDIFLRLAFQVTELALFHPLVNLAVSPHSTYQDGRLCLTECRPLSRYSFEIAHQVVGSQSYTAMLCVGVEDSWGVQLPETVLW